MNLIKIPFEGFTGTIHGDWMEEFAQGEHVDVKATMKEYCKQYVLKYNQYLPQGISIEYSHFTNPKEYSTQNPDTLIGTISEASIQILYKEGFPKLAPYVKKAFKATNTYVPHYSDNLAHWGSVDIWSSVQLGCLLEVMVGDYMAHPYISIRASSSLH